MYRHEQVVQHKNKYTKANRSSSRPFRVLGMRLGDVRMLSGDHNQSRRWCLVSSSGNDEGNQNKLYLPNENTHERIKATVDTFVFGESIKSVAQLRYLRSFDAGRFVFGRRQSRCNTWCLASTWALVLACTLAATIPSIPTTFEGIGKSAHGVPWCCTQSQDRD